MRAIALVVLAFLPFLANASTPIMEDEALACISGGLPSKAGQAHSVSINNGDELEVLLPGTLASAFTLKSAERHTATFKVDGLTTQTISFGFKKMPARDVCFRYDKSKEVWSISDAAAGMCGDCSLESDGT